MAGETNDGGDGSMKRERPPFAPNPRVVFLHDREHSNLLLPARNAGLEPPYSVRGFTDLRMGPSPLNGGLHGAASNADVLFVQRTLIDPKTPDAHLALCAVQQAISPRGYRTHTYSYGDDYTVEYVHPSMVRELNLRGWDLQDEEVVT